MLKNYFKIALRGLRNKISFTIINVSGLTIGMASAILILMWVQNEYSYDGFHKNKENLYKAWNHYKGPGYESASDITASPLAKSLKEQYPEIKNTARVYWDIDRLFSYGDKSIKATGNDVDKSFLTMFTFPLIKGNSNHALDHLNSIVITRKLAEKLFGRDNPIDKIVTVNQKQIYKVSGVLQNLPPNSQFQFDYLVNLSANEKYYSADSWTFNSYNTYVQLQPGVSIEQVSKKIKNLIVQHDTSNKAELFLHPIDKWHLYSRFENGKPVGGRIDTVRLLIIIAMLVLFIACINFMNLSTAQSQKRAKEISVRKVIGATRKSLINQFLSESILITFISGCLSLVIAQLVAPAFNQLTGEQMFINYASPLFWLSFIGFILITGLLAGSYPAFVLSKFNPVKVLKGVFKTGKSPVNLRKVLVVSQFSIATVLIISTIVIYRQIRFAQNRDTGYHINNLIEIPVEGDIDKNYQLIKSDLLNTGAATSVCRTSLSVTVDGRQENGYSTDGVNKDQQKLNFSRFGTSGDFVKTLGITLIEGRDIDLNNYASDSSACLLNETAAKSLGLKNPIGKTITNGNGQLHIVGVIKDFILNSPYVNISPMLVIASKKWSYNTVIRLNSKAGIANSIKKAEDIFKKYNSDYPFNYQFVDQEYDKKFKDQKQAGIIAALFAGLTIFISCLGLFGLAAYMAENRLKEIGIRKVLGASVADITKMLTSEFVILVIIAIVIAIPVSYVYMQKWLQDFNYRISIGLPTFLLAGIIAITIAILTVAMQSVKAALANPAKSIRTE
ncbi:ABC transporter permease [Mucilaginibacter sp. KACC 22063]|uniref:ABC transporter permease n=1 Tax=Mucilaginibacter sp. KACC 22063 TaxID=3025666 RepID=UPI00236627CF|nr:ABC transporter permease [Mucilaginibacter sp. KACC 22063]WDF53626.1 ABC transporter permease [Mucilaginibacter sp. KACC 22063]